MESFKFNFSKFGKPKIKSNNLPRRRIATNLIGVIGIKLNGTYYVQIGDKQYDLTLESYDIKDKNVYYAKKLQNNKIVEIITLNKRTCNSKQYLPFGVGCIVKGNLYEILLKERFNISKILTIDEISTEDYNILKNISHEKKKFFRDNYNEILQCMN